MAMLNNQMVILNRKEQSCVVFLNRQKLHLTRARNGAAMYFKCKKDFWTLLAQIFRGHWLNMFRAYPARLRFFRDYRGPLYNIIKCVRIYIYIYTIHILYVDLSTHGVFATSFCLPDSNA